VLRPVLHRGVREPFYAPVRVANHPAVRRSDQVDDYHGTSVADPFRWMENVADPELVPWLAAQAELVSRFAADVPCRARFESRLRELNTTEGVGVPRRRGDRTFQSRTDGLYLLGDPDRLVFDGSPRPGGVVVGDVEPSPDGTKLLWCETTGGSDWRTWHVTDVDTGQQLNDAVGDAKLWARWLPDGESFLYIAFPSEGDDRSRATATPQLRVHRLGSSDDLTIFEDSRYFFPSVTSDGRFVVLTHLMAPGAGLSVAEIGSWAFERLFTIESDLWFVGSRDETFYFCTTEGAPYGRIASVRRGSSDWETVVPESDAVIPLVSRSCLVGEWVLVVREHLGLSRMELHKGDESYEVDLPEACRFVMADVSEPVSSDASGFFFAVTSPRSPATILRHDIDSRSTRVVSEATSSVEIEVAAEVVWATSRDGTEVPMTLVRAAGSASLASPPVIIEGYGGGGDSMEPYDFVPWKLAWLEAGGVVASAHIRGGLELGAAWREAAARGGKKLAMEDFVACAGWLIDKGYTTAERIGITGRSSGAMLAAAAVVNSPRLFGACVAEVGMFDPLRYHNFGLGSLMIAEYGTSDDPDDFAAMIAYSPLHNVVEGVSYPPFLLTVHTDDDRVAPGGGYKFAAALQAAGAPALLRLQGGLGHHWGGGDPGAVEERADILAFFAHHLGLPGC
jgi:prolyl oligopeptidase